MASRELACWLRDRKDLVMVKWIRAVRKASPGTDSLLPTKELGARHLEALYDAFISALDTGDVSPLEAILEQLVKDRLKREYNLREVLVIATELKRTCWEEITKEFPSLQALEYIQKAEELFDRMILKMTSTFTDESFAFIKRLNRSLEQKVRERTQELQRAKEELERIDKAKSDFIRIAAHELRTPLTLVQGYVGMLAAEDFPDKSRLQSILQGLNKGIARLESIIRDLIDVSYIDAEVLTLSLQPVPMSQIFQSLLIEFQPALQNRRLNLSLSGLEELPLVEGDPQRLRQVFYNLLSNAIKYTPDGGSITVTGQLIRGETDFVHITVKDTGIGIPPDKLERIFDKFYRVEDFKHHSTSKTDFKGAGPGLGLTIARGIVEAHGGKIWAESPGYDEKRLPGSSFHVLLPVKAQPPRSVYIHQLKLPVRAVIFDLDGVMVDTAPYHFQAWQKALAEFGLEMSYEQFRSTFGMRNQEIIRTLYGSKFTSEQVEEIGRRKDAIYRELVYRHLTPMPGLLRLIQDLKAKRFRIAVATSTSKPNASLILKTLKLEHEIVALVTEEDVEFGKPDPEIFLKAAEKCMAQPQNCIVIEDSPAGIQAAKSAGMKAVALTTTRPQEELREADLIVESLMVLTPEILESLLEKGSS
ncbi:MAG: beta-phosphoglucomutase family hydrolase [Anaerolineae bacterium]|nr:beta-phosphoglucomutase family hydrolase [Anaerolineae bacterium]MDW8101850.1 beta-phosphoglucomutase family hydrolase [Anaerolineae bacterium]